MQKSLSIVIPAYNEEHHLPACLESIARQTVMPDEVIVVDNNSTDKTVEVAKCYSFVKLVHESKQGIIFARNHGFDIAQSDIIGRIDADTILPSDWTAQIIDFYNESDHELVAWTGGGYFYNLPFVRIGGWVQGQIAYRMNRFLMGYYILWGSNMALPQAMWREAKSQTCSRNDIHEDVDLAIHVHRVGYQIAYQEGTKVGVAARRVQHLFDYKSLWENLSLWPRTLKVHGNRGWVFGYAGAAGLFALWPALWLLLMIRAFFVKLARRLRA